MHRRGNGGFVVRQYVRHLFRRGTSAQIATAVGLAGEPFWATDTQQMFVGDATYRAVPVQTLDMAVIDRASALVCIDRTNGTIIYKF